MERYGKCVESLYSHKIENMRHCETNYIKLKRTSQHKSHPIRNRQWLDCWLRRDYHFVPNPSHWPWRVPHFRWVFGTQWTALASFHLFSSLFWGQFLIFWVRLFFAKVSLSPFRISTPHAGSAQL